MLNILRTKSAGISYTCRGLIPKAFANVYTIMRETVEGSALPPLIAALNFRFFPHPR